MRDTRLTALQRVNRCGNYGLIWMNAQGVQHKGCAITRQPGNPFHLQLYSRSLWEGSVGREPTVCWQTNLLPVIFFFHRGKYAERSINPKISCWFSRSGLTRDAGELSYDNEWMNEILKDVLLSRKCFYSDSEL